ncbi:MAG: type II secretion system F family protein [Syntrophales bacterium]|jgi:tight adherence protein C|nr:type II secretion system F family protein [Syntrophales bacterium]MDY0043610.1 type II secretion system F family protein [Syntrophales bacterium]
MFSLPEEHLPFALALLNFLIFFFLFITVARIFQRLSKTRRLMEKIRYEDSFIPESSVRESNPPEKKGRTRFKIMNVLGNFGSHFISSDSEEYSGLRLRFLRAGLHHVNMPSIFYASKLISAICLPIAFLALNLVHPIILNVRSLAIVMVILAVAAYYLPVLLLSIRRTRRKRKLIRGLPDALDLLVVSVEAGLGLDAAINIVRTEMAGYNKPISEEFKYLNLEIRMGQPRQLALRHLAMRADIEEMTILVTTLIQTEKFGTSIARALRVCSDGARTKYQQAAEEAAAKMPVKLVFPLIACIFPALFVITLGPAIIKIIKVLIPLLRQNVGQGL